MANDLLVRILGDTRGLERSFAQANRATATFGRNIDTTATKADRAAKSFTAFGRGAVAGFGGAVAITAATRAIGSAITAAAEAEQVLGQTRVAVEQTGKSWEQYGKTIQDAIAEQSKFGFDDEALLRTFSLFVRQSNDVGEALRRNNIAMDIARARFIDLEQAASLVNKAALGQSGALRRIGIDARRGATGVELLAQLEREFGGAAEEASSSAQASLDRYNVAVENLKEKLGGALLPAMTAVVDMLTRTIEGAEKAADALGRIGDVEIPPIKIPFFFDFPGGSVGGAVSDSLDFLQGIEANILNLVGASARESARDIAVGTEDAAEQFKQAVEDIPRKFTDAIQGAGFRRANPSLVGIRDAIKSFTDSATSTAQAAVKEGQRRIDAATAKAKREDFFEKLIAGLELGVDRAALTRVLNDDLDALRDLRAGLQRQIAAGVDVQAAQNDLVRVERDILDTTEEMTRNRRAATAARRQASQFRDLGLSATGDEIIPGIQNLQQRIEGALRRISSGELDVSGKLVDRLRLARNLIRKEGKSLTAETRSVINGLIKTVTQGQKELTSGPLTKASSLNANKLLKGLGLGPDMERELRARLSSFNTAGQRLSGGGARPTGGFVGGVPVVESHVTVKLDEETVGRSVTRTQQKQRRRNPQQKRGPNSGI